MKHPTVWLVGDFRGAEFAFATAGLPSSSFCRRFPSIDMAMAESTTGHSCPEVIVLAQSRPGRLSAAAVERLHAAYPLSRLITLLGAWCEGEMRTGQPIRGTTRIFWHAFPTQLGRLLKELREGQRAPWAFPRIAGQQERVLEEMPLREVHQPVDHAGVLLVRAVNLTTFETLAEALRRQGQRCQWLDTRQPVRYRACDALLWDAPQLDRLEWQLLSSTRATLAPAPLIMLAGFPRQDDHQRARSLGARALIAKPYLVADLVSEVDLALSHSTQAASDERQMAS